MSELLSFDGVIRFVHFLEMIKSVLLDATVVNKNNIETIIPASGYYNPAQINQ